MTCPSRPIPCLLALLLHQIDIRADNVAIGPRQRLLGISRDGRVELWGLPPGS